jgi:hypothetical protein
MTRCVNSPEKIAVILSDSGEVTSLGLGSRLCVYEHASGHWARSQTIEYNLCFTGREELFGTLRYLVEKLGDCRIVAGTAITGLVMHLLNHVGFSTYEISESSDEVFDMILSDAYGWGDAPAEGGEGEEGIRYARAGATRVGNAAQPAPGAKQAGAAQTAPGALSGAVMAAPEALAVGAARVLAPIAAEFPYGLRIRKPKAASGEDQEHNRLRQLYESLFFTEVMAEY